MRGGHTALATAAILKNSKGDPLKAAFDGLAEVICNPEWKVAEKELEQQADEEKKAENEVEKKKINKKKVIVNPLAEAVS